MDRLTILGKIDKMIEDEFYSLTANTILTLVRELNIKSFVEVGAYYGRTAEFLLNNHKFDRYFIVDIWNNQSDGLFGASQESIDFVRRECFKKLSEFNNVSIIQLPSTEASNLFHPKSVDAVYIDASHEENHVWEDIMAWHAIPRVLFFGDDYWMGSVSRSVDRIYPTVDSIENGNSSKIWIRK